MTERKMRDDERLCKLSAWMANHNVMEVAKQCGVTRDSLHKSIRAGRVIYVYVNRLDRITYAFECIGKVGVFGFKSREVSNTPVKKKEVKEVKKQVSRSLLYRKKD